MPKYQVSYNINPDLTESVESDLQADNVKRLQVMVASLEPPVETHSRNSSDQISRYQMQTSRRLTPYAYRLVASTLTKEKQSYFMLTVIISMLSTGGWIISTSYSIENIITWITVVIFLYLYNIVKQHLSCTSNSGGYKIHNISKSTSITIAAGETVLIECIPIEIDMSNANNVNFPEYCQITIIERIEKTYMRITNLYKYYKIVLPLDPSYCIK